MQGVPTPDDVVAEFRARFLYSGNASAVARELKLSPRTGREIAERIEDEPGFAADRRKLRERALERHVAMRIRVAEVAADRFEADLPEPMPSADGAPIVIVDKRSDYGRLVLDAEKNAHNLARFDAEKSGDLNSGAALVIITSDRAEEPAGGGQDGAASTV